MTRILGLDVGIGSCGWAFADEETVNSSTGEVKEFEVLACGARCFDVPEEAKTKELKNKKRRQYRGQRRVIRRRAQRLAQLRRLLSKHGLPPDPGELARGTPSGIVWQLRADGLDRILTLKELSRVLIHIAKHRGFKSNSKREQANKASEDGKMLAAVTALDSKSAKWRTVGEMLAKDQAFENRKRNTVGDYSHTLLRKRIEEEAHKVLHAQRRKNSPHVSDELIESYMETAFFQRPLRSSVELIGHCRFEPDQLRTPRHAPSFEQFRFLSRLNNLRLSERGKRPVALTPEQRSRAIGLFASVKELTFKKLRSHLGLGEATRFEALPAIKNPESAKVAGFTGSVQLGGALGRSRFVELLADVPGQLDAAMSAIIFHETDEEVERELELAGVEPQDIDALMDHIGDFAGLRGAGQISAKACRNLLPHLAEGHVYSEACRRAGYDHTALGDVSLDALKNPVVRKVIAEALRQIKTLFRAYGEPDLIHIEMARSLGKSAKDRNDIRRSGEQRAADRERHRRQFTDIIGGRLPNDEELERYELWLEQDHHCLYGGDYISPTQLVAGDNSIQVDHILPYSRSGDDSFRNKALVTAKANQDKRDRTLWEWFGESDPERWDELRNRLELNKSLHRQKRRNLLIKTFADRETAYRERHLQDTRYAVRLLRMLIEREWPRYATLAGGTRPIRTRPGAITAMVRRGLGLDEAKKSGMLGDRDHALDALIVAWTTESILKRLTDEAKHMEQVAAHRHIPSLIADRGDKERLRQLFLRSAEAVFVSRPENRRGRGPAHDATLYGFEETPDGEVQYERKAVSDIKRNDLDRLKGDPERTGTLRDVLARWLDEADAQGVKPAKFFETTPPRMHKTGADKKAPAIRKVYLVRQAKSGLKIRRGSAEAHADLATMVRVDVFDKKGKNYLVPVYAYQIANRKAWPLPPMLAVKAATPETGWHAVDETYQFRFTLYSGSLVGWLDKNGDQHFGYFRALDRATGAISVAPPGDSNSSSQIRISPMSLKNFQKYTIDRLGARHPIGKEPREWRGEVCT